MSPLSLWPLPLLLLAGCASPQGKFQAVKDPSYAGKLERVLIVYFNLDTASTLGRDFSDGLATKLAALLAQKNVPAEVVRLERAALDRNAPVKAAAVRFHPKQFLYLNITRVRTSAGSHQSFSGDVIHFTSDTSANFEFSLVEAQTGRTVWRTEAYYFAPPHAEDVAAQLIEQIIAARLF